jgi:hypothetical protein
MTDDSISNEKDKTKRPSFIQAHYLMLWKYHDLPMALVYGWIEQLTLKRGGCKGSEQATANWCGISRSTVQRAVKKLIREKYIVDKTPTYKNEAHTLMATKKFKIEEEAFFRYYFLMKDQIEIDNAEMEEVLEISDHPDTDTGEYSKLFEFFQLYQKAQEKSTV